MRTRFIVFLLVFCLQGCPLSPQLVTIKPTLNDSTLEEISSYNVFKLIVRDERETNILGQRGGPYKETALLKTKEDVSENISNSLKTTFENSGFSINDETTNQLVVSLMHLSYESEGETRVSAVQISAEVKANVATLDGAFTKQYKARHRKEVLLAPNEETNEKLINDVLGAVVQRVLNDKELLVYLKN